MRGRSCTAAVLALVVAALALGCGRDTPLAKARSVAAVVSGQRHFDHVVIVVLENEDAERVDAVPYMRSLAQQGFSLRNYHGVAHPSYPNYLALVSGQTFVDDEDPRTRRDPTAYAYQDVGDAQRLIDAPSIIDRLEAQRTSWDAFAEDYPIEESAPTACDWRRGDGLYARKHVPFLSFTGFHEHPEWCAHVHNLKWFRADSLAAYTFVTPNLVHDGHDAPLASAAVWLQGFIEPILADPSTLIVVTFDESSSSMSALNLIYTVLLGDMVKAGATSNVPYDHFNLLRTVEVNFGLAPSLLPGDVGPIDDAWR